MTDHDRDPEPLSPELRALLGPEREAGAAPGKERVRARLEATLFPPPGGGGSGSGSGGSGGALGRAAAIFLAGGIVGGALVWTLAPTKVQVVERAVTVTAPTPAASAAPPESATVALPVATHQAQAPSASASPPSPSAIADSLAQERAMLDPARVAIGRGDGASALDAVRRHEARYPAGKLAEEREAIAVQALVLAGRKDEARARGARFLARYPGSVLAPAVQAALDAAAAPP